ncbi:MAG: TSUP family transporter [Pseudomonadota bacterium]
MVSVPAAWIGGRIPVQEIVFVGVLGGALLFSGLRLLTTSTPDQEAVGANEMPIGASLGIGGLIGGLAGLVGIGGGIFLAPILYMARWGTPREIAGACSLFIFCNSLSGLLGQGAKLAESELTTALLSFWPLALGVLVGGQIGSWLGSAQLRSTWIKRLTALLILYVAARLLIRFAGAF